MGTETGPAAGAPTPPSFFNELTSLINRYSQENGSDTPDFILSSYLEACLAAFDKGVNRRDVWYGYGKPPVEIHTPSSCDCGAKPDRPHTHGRGAPQTPDLA